MYFFIGFILDIIITLYYKKIAQNKAYAAGLLSFVVTIVNLIVYERIILGSGFWLQSVKFALGCALGTLLTLKIDRVK